MDAKPQLVTISAECLCKAHIFITEIPASKLPLPSNVCHCNSCRHSTGAMYVIETTWPQPIQNVDISGLITYRFSDNIVYRFCGTCSTLMFYESKSMPNKLGVYSGALKNIDANLLYLTKNIFVEDTLDGGASVWFRRPNSDGRELRRYTGFGRDSSEEMSWDWPMASGSEAEVEERKERNPLPVWCHCKGVKLQLNQGDYGDRSREDLPWFIDPRTNKPLAVFDVCDSCRLHFGFEITNWTLASLDNISQADGSPMPRTTAKLKAAVDAGDSAQIGSLAYYQSSPGVQRYFCKSCSAAVFFACDDRPDMVDLAIGLLEAPDGARAENYLSWDYESISRNANDARGGWRESLIKRVQADAEEFRNTTAYPKTWRRLVKDT